MCEINPKHSMVMRLEVFTSHPMTEEEFTTEVMERLLMTEMQLNADGRFRFHIHETDATDQAAPSATMLTSAVVQEAPLRLMGSRMAEPRDLQSDLREDR